MNWGEMNWQERAEKAEAELAKLRGAPNEIRLGKGEFVLWPVKTNGVHGLAFVKTDDPKAVGTYHPDPEDGQIEIGAGDSAIYFGNAESAMVLAERLQYVISLMLTADAAPVPSPDDTALIEGVADKLGLARDFGSRRHDLQFWLDSPEAVPTAPDVPAESEKYCQQRGGDGASCGEKCICGANQSGVPETNGERAVGASVVANAVPEEWLVAVKRLMDFILHPSLDADESILEIVAVQKLLDQHEDAVVRALLQSTMTAPASAAAPAVPEGCRQRLQKEGKPYPRSSCSVCGQFSQKWRECDALLQSATQADKEV